jgi:hypothetical protein
MFVSSFALLNQFRLCLAKTPSSCVFLRFLAHYELRFQKALNR